jgi:pimeloyl-ACP methyl ester carboxylesterase
MKQRSISLKAYHCPQTGREIHYSFAHLRAREKDTDSSIHDDTTSVNINNDTACWVFFYPAGPNRRLLEAVISRYEGEFECCRDVIFLCLNRPGKGGSSSSSRGEEGRSSNNHHAGSTNHGQLSLEQEYIRRACNDVITIIDYYEIHNVNLLYMCAGSTFAYSFAAQYADRTTGYIVGLSSWILRHDGDKLNTDNNTDNNDSISHRSSDSDIIDCATPTNMNSTIHSIAMRGYLGPKSIISSLAGNIISSIAPNVFNIVPQQWIVDGFKKELSFDEQVEFDAQFPNDGGVDFVELMKWMYDDGDGDGSVFVNVDDAEAAAELHNDKHRVPNMNDGNAKDIAVCLSSQHDLGLEYKSSIPKQKRVLLYHGENDKMVNVVGAEYLESMLSNATLSYVFEGTHQGTMLFFPIDVMLELNQISSLKQD